MFESFILLTLISAVVISTKYFMNKHKKTKFKIKETYDKINSINSSINKKIRERKGELYYDNLKNSYKPIKDKVSNIQIKINSNTLQCVKETLIIIDTYNIRLNKDLNRIDEFLHFNESFSTKKRNYRKNFNKSVEILDEISEKYGETILKYVNEFNKDYNTYKQNDITILNKYVKQGIKCVEEYDVRGLNKHFSDIKQIDNDIDIRLTEPSRLFDKLNVAENNVEQLESELDNVQGSLYSKTFNIIKNNRVTQEETNEWNSLKRKINYYKKNRLLKTDIIKLNKDLNQIINSMVELCDKVKDNAPTENHIIENQENHTQN